jgi:hypothetical protein
MNTTNHLIFFRGRSTTSIISHAQRLGVIRPQDHVSVVARPHDALAQPGDLCPTDIKAPTYDSKTNIVIVGNGWATSQIIPILVRIFEAYASQITQGLAPQWNYQVIELRTSEVVVRKSSCEDVPK